MTTTVNSIFEKAKARYAGKKNDAFTEIKASVEKILLTINEVFPVYNVEVEYSDYYKRDTVRFDHKDDKLYTLCVRIAEILNVFSMEKFSIEEDSMKINITHKGADIYLRFDNDKKEIVVLNYYDSEEDEDAGKYKYSIIHIEYPDESNS